MSENGGTRVFSVACLEIDDVSLVVVFADAGFASLSEVQQEAAHAALRESALRLGLQGSVVTMWKDADGRKRFIAEPQQRPFFESVRYDQLYAQRNRTIGFSDP